MAEELTYEEFSAIRKRERAREQVESNASTSAASEATRLKRESTTEKKKDTHAGKRAEVRTKGSITMLASLGDFMEKHETQFFCIFLLLVDSYMAYLLAILNPMASELQTSEAKLVVETIIPLIRSFTAFTQIYFMLELVLIFLSFGLAVIGHLGYTIDFFVVALQFYFDLIVAGRESRILNIIRLWRTYRLLTSMVNAEKEAHEDTLELLEETEVAHRKTQLELVNVEEDLKREKEARVSVEEMLSQYKEEVDTLNEALKIAARDIAEVAEADDELFLTDEEVEAEAAADGEGDGEDGMSRGGQSRSSATGSKASSGPATFVINSDGTFDRR